MGSREFAHSTGTRRPDGRYVVARRGASSSGHRKVFDSFEALEGLYRNLPPEMTAADVEQRAQGLTGSRRHLLLWHFLEHPRFECVLESRQPLMVRKRDTD